MIGFIAIDEVIPGLGMQHTTVECGGIYR